MAKERMGYTPPSDHRRNAAEYYPATPVPGTILPDGYPLSIGDDFVFGTDDVDPNNNNAPVHIGGFPDLSRETADAFIKARKLESFTKGRDEPAWGAGFTLVRDAAGAPHLLVGPDESPHLLDLGKLPERVRQGMDDLGGLWLDSVPLPVVNIPKPVAGEPKLTRDEVREIVREEIRLVIDQLKG